MRWVWHIYRPGGEERGLVEIEMTAGEVVFKGDSFNSFEL
jgi:predicted small integral membrane protein